MALQIRKVPESQRSILLLKEGEPLYTIDEKKLYIGDGVTRGGINILDGISLLEYLDADIQHDPIEDNDFIFWNPSTSRWTVGKRDKVLLELEDIFYEDGVTAPVEDQIIIYHAANNEWILTADRSNLVQLLSLTDTSGDLEALLDVDEQAGEVEPTPILQYDASTQKWDAIPLPPPPDLGDLQEITLTGNPQLGQMLFNDPATEQYINDYAGQSVAPAYNCGLYTIQDKDIIKFSSSIGKFVNHSPTLVGDVPEVSNTGLQTYEPPAQTYYVGLSSDGSNFTINNETAHDLTAFKDRKLVFDLSNASLTGKTFKLSATAGGTHNVEETGTIWQSSLITETGTPGVDGRIEIDIRPYFKDEIDHGVDFTTGTEEIYSHTDVKYADLLDSDYWVVDPDYDPVVVHEEGPLAGFINVNEGTPLPEEEGYFGYVGFLPPTGDEHIPVITFEITGSIPDPNAEFYGQEAVGVATVEDAILEDDLPGFYYFCPEEAGFGAKIQIKKPEDPQPWTLIWDQSANGFNLQRFDATIGSFGDVVLQPDEDGFLFDNQMLAYDVSIDKWTTPLDRVVGLGISSGLPRRYEEYANFLWAGGSQGLGEFNYSMPAEAEIEDIFLDLSEVEVEGSDEEFDAFFFDTEEDREYFYELVEELEQQLAAAGSEPTLTRQQVYDKAMEAKGRFFRQRTRKRSYSREGRSKPATSEKAAEVTTNLSGIPFPAGAPNLSGLFGGGSGMGGGGKESSSLYGGDGWAGSEEGSTEPSLEDLIDSEEFPDPQRTADEFKEAYKNFNNNVKKIFGAVLARNRAFDKLMPRSTRDPADNQNSTLTAADRFTNEIRIKFSLIDVASDPIPPMMFGWNTYIDTYGYYFFTFSSRGSALTFNTRNHEIIPHTYMRRVGATIDRTSQFQVHFYYDADDSTKIAGEWLRIVEYQSAQSAYNGIITEVPSTIVREGMEEWDENVLYQKGNRVLYDDKVWECLVRTTKGFPPAPGTVTAPEFLQDQFDIQRRVNMFVEIPHFSVKSQKFDGVYQLRCTYGSDTGGGLTHPAFRFSEDPGDIADYVYIGCNLMSGPDASHFHNNHSYVVGPRDSIKTTLDNAFLDNGLYLFDINIHSLLQHLMVSEFQTMNLEKALGENNETMNYVMDTTEREFALGVGNGSGYLSKSANSGISCYRGIYKIYGNSGYHIDGINTDPSTFDTYYQVDNFKYYDNEIKPDGYIDLHPLPQINLDSSNNAEAWIRDFWNFIEADFTDFVYYLPRYTGGSRANFLADKIFYRNINTSSNLPLKMTIGKTGENNTNASQGAYGPHSVTVSPNPSAAARLIVRRKGAALVPRTQGTGNSIQIGNLYNVDGEILRAEIPQPDPALLATGDYWVADSVLEEQQIVIGPSSITGEKNSRTMSLARLLLSKSAVCIAMCDESDSQNAKIFYDLWDEFRALFPDRTFNLLIPSHDWSDGSFAHSSLGGPTSSTNISLADLTNPLGHCPVHKNTITIRPKYRQQIYHPEYDMVERACVLDYFFPNTTEFFPTSENARLSSPMTYRWEANNNHYKTTTSVAYTRATTPASNGGYTDFLKANAVMSYPIFNQVRAKSLFPANDGNNYFPSGQGVTRNYKYKIRIPAYTSTTSGQMSDGVFFQYACDGNMTVDVYNPHTGNTINIVTNYSNYSSNGETHYNNQQVIGNFTPVDIYNNDLWLEMNVAYTNDTGSEDWEDNPGIFAINIYIKDQTDSATNPYNVPIFLCRDYSCPETDHWFGTGGGADRLSHMSLNFALDPQSYGKSYGPFAVGRDNGSSTYNNLIGVTDIFELCNLSGALPGTLVGLFVDRSGSMTQTTINASYQLLYQKCAAANLEIVEVQNSSEDWITPFIQEI